MENENVKIETQIPMNAVILNGKIGRKRKLTKEDLLNAIAKYQTTSPYELAKLLTEKQGIECSHMTVYRLLKQIPQTEIDSMLKAIAEEQLKPYEMEYKVFLQLPEMQEYLKTLYTQKLSKPHLRQIIRGLYHLCIQLNIRPKALTVEKLPMIRDYIINVEQGKASSKVSVKLLIRGIREWYLYSVGISKETINKYISSISPIVGKYAREKIEMAKREAFLIELKKYLTEKGELN